MKKLIPYICAFATLSLGIAFAVNTYPPYPGPRNSSAVFLVDSGSTVYPPLPSPRNSSPVFLVDPTTGLPSGNTLPSPVLLTLTTCPSGPCNYTVPAGVTLLRGVDAGAGGGGGGVSAATATASAGLPGIMTSFVMIVTPGQVISYTIGASGTRGANTGGNGGLGGDTIFGTLTAKGGVGGIGSASGNAAAQQSAGQSGSAAQIAMFTGSKAIPTTTVAITGLSMDAILGNPGGSGSGGSARGIWGSSTVGTNGSATDCVGFNTGGSGAGSTTNTAGTGALGCPGAIFLW